MPTRSIQLGIRCTPEELKCIRAAATALAIETSVLVEIAMLDQCKDLRLVLGSPTVPRVSAGPAWDFVSARTGATGRITVYANPLVHPTFEAAAWALRVSVPVFAVGSSLQFIATLKSDNATRREEKTYNNALAKVDVPYGF